LQALADLAGVLAYGDLLGEALVAIDAEWRIALVNETALRFAGRPRDELVGRSYWEVVPLARGSAIERALREAMSSGLPVELEGESRMHSGRYNRGIAIPLSDGLAISFREVTVERSAESERERRHLESEERARLAIEAAAIGTWDVDVPTGTRRWSSRFRAILGVGEDVTPDPKLFLSLIDPRDRERVDALYRDAYQGVGDGRYAAEFRIRRVADGVERWVSTRGKVFFDEDGRALRGIGALIDVTARKRTEEALRESEQRLRATQEHAGIGIAETDREGRYLRVNEAFCEITAYPAEELIGTPCWPLTHPSFSDAERRQYEATVAGGADAYTIEKLFFRRDGTVRWAWLSSTAIRDEGGEFLYAVRALLDITERKEAEERQELLINELNHRVKNTLATVQSIAAQTLRNAPTLERARSDFEHRLIGLSRVHDVLTRENWEGARLREIVAQAVEPFDGGGGRFDIHGPELRLEPGRALAIAMALQELATNAAKYGALSGESGKVEIAWRVAGEPGQPRMHLRWVERDGPPVAPPQRRGFGSRLIERSLAQDLDGEVTLSFEPGGVVCTLNAPIATRAAHGA
jgi:PAS domain S-box-containing protein